MFLHLKVARDFSSAPGSRLKIEGENSAEEFRSNYLIPLLDKAIDTNQVLKIDLDGAAGYGCSFLEESFGGLIRQGYKFQTLKEHLSIKSDEEPELIEEINEYLLDSHCRGGFSDS